LFRSELPIAEGARPALPQAHDSRILKSDDFASNRHPALDYCWSVMFSDLPSPAEASGQLINLAKGFALAGNRYPLFGIMP